MVIRFNWDWIADDWIADDWIADDWIYTHRSEKTFDLHNYLVATNNYTWNWGEELWDHYDRMKIEYTRNGINSYSCGEE